MKPSFQSEYDATECSCRREEADRSGHGKSRPRYLGRYAVSATRIRWLRIAVLLTAVLPLRAHDIYSSWADVYLRGERLDITFTLARSSAVGLLPGGQTLPPITPQNFPDYADKLKAVAPELFALTLAEKPLRFLSAEPRVSGDNDVVFQLAYALPARPTGKLRFVANYLRHVVDGHVGTIVVMQPDGKDLGWSPVSLDQPVFEVQLPAPAPKSGGR